MPLSEHEQRLLEQLEKQLHEDRRFASNMKAPSSTGRLSTRNIALGILLVILGLAGLIFGISQQIIVVGVIGFAVMFGGVMLALKKSAAGKIGQGAKPRAGSNAKNNSQFMSGLEEKWNQRKRDQSDG
ncbi:DUF3040 domain-containing protein [Glutamicibacter soli]|uniref:DUF3040 domain-containing protein n=1 Tax=Glutamicibacter soli TaxID=453836 RepID=A0A365YPM6_9MICC|nr:MULTISPECIES: DUF3040 domain-containing protein [Micrococcaceae]ALQ30385.1 hypothetical protein ATC04_07295 [Arthrobacter sp. YC-RL1]KLI88316.1 membrane protein [Arthrobacter sp. YC-RL1]NAZ14575.1 DUF3040 domain-containing protein [Glutamicibacter soli]RBM04210.1 DUF3040 domain-containing protein [Glutamicibacter soli]RKS22515.1 hypothetical protein DFO58_0547 [Arthrobacter sp. AG1021]